MAEKVTMKKSTQNVIIKGSGHVGSIVFKNFPAEKKMTVFFCFLRCFTSRVSVHVTSVVGYTANTNGMSLNPNESTARHIAHDIMAIFSQQS